MRAFDHVFTPFEHSVDRMRELHHTSFHHVPFGVDAPELAPRQFDHDRALDIASIGRRPAELHRALRQAARSRDLSYYYDTYARPTITDHVEHRDAHYQLARHSKFWLCYPAKFDTPAEQGGQIEVGPRYYEAVGAGALVLGDDAPGRTWENHLPESMEVRKVAGASTAAAEIAEVVESWPSTLPERVEGVAHTLRQSDWAHRWRTMTRIAGLQAATAVHERIARLDAEAAELLTRWL